jgi:hypothetical protein
LDRCGVYCIYADTDDAEELFMSREAMKLALEALEFIPESGSMLGAQAETKRLQGITALREALANEALDRMAENARALGLDYEPAQQQQPVAYLCENAVGHKYFRWKKPSSTYKPIALYTTPPAQLAVPDAIGPNEDELPSYAAGWNDCRALMLEMRKP